MATNPKIRGDRLVIAMLSVMRTLVIELDKAGAIDLDTLLSAIDDTAATHRQHGDSNQLADAIEAIATHLREFYGSTPHGQTIRALSSSTIPPPSFVDLFWQHLH